MSQGKGQALPGVAPSQWFTAGRCCGTLPVLREVPSMPFRLLLAASAVLWAAGSAPAGDCPDTEFTLEAREELIRKAPSCQEALAMMEACAYGASGDVVLGTVVMEKCEADFIARLGKGERLAYARKVSRCDRKYRNESGTMYRSFEAFCRAGGRPRLFEEVRQSRRPQVSLRSAPLSCASAASSARAGWRMAGSRPGRRAIRPSTASTSAPGCRHR